MATIQVSTKNFTGRSISITNNRVFIDGKEVTGEDSKQINITVTGDVDVLDVDACDKVSITGQVGSVKTMSGDIDVQGDIKGSISTMSGDVDCGNIGGNVSTLSGDIKHRKS